MKIITALTAQRRNHNRVNVFLDGEFAFGLAAAAAARLKVGQSLDAEDIAKLQRQDDLEKAKQSAFRFLSYRPRSTAEVQRNLTKAGYDEQLVEQVIAHLQQVSLLDDEAFARYWVEQRETFRPRSRLALQQELYQKGVSREIIELVLSAVDETAVARRAATKAARRWINLPEEEFRVKLGRFLQRRGFHYEIITQVTNEIWRDVESGTSSREAIT